MTLSEEAHRQPERLERAEATRRALLAAGRQLFGERGYGRTSLNALVSAAGVTKGALYHHFGGKEEIFLHVYESVKAEIARAAFIAHVDYRPFADDGAHVPARGPLKMAVDQDPGSLWRDLETRCRRYVELHADSRVQRIVLLDARAVLDWESWRRVEREHGVVLLRADLRRAIHRGVVRPLPLHALAMILAGALHEACLLLAHADDPVDAREEAFSVVGALLDGLRTESAPESGGRS